MNRKPFISSAYWMAACMSVALLLMSASATVRADDTHMGVFPPSMVSLTGAVAVGGESYLIRVGSSADFVVPADKALVLTDIVFSPQVFSSLGDFQLQVLPGGGTFSTALTLFASAAEPSSLQVNLTSGMVFRAGSMVKVSLVLGSAPVNVSAFGYLVSVN